MMRRVRPGLLCLAIAMSAHGAMADPIVELQCHERKWRDASNDLQESRAALWAAVDRWLTAPGQAHCDRITNIGDDLLSSATFGWRCNLGAGDAETTLTFQRIDDKKLSLQQDRMMVLGIIYAFSGPELQEALEESAAELEDSLNDMAEALATAFEAMPPEDLLALQAADNAPDIETAPDEPQARETMTIEELVAPILPLQNRLGLTAEISLSFKAEDDVRAALGLFLDTHRLLQGLERVGGGDVAANASERVNDAVAGQAEIWSREHLPLTASHFRLFGQPAVTVQTHDDRITVIDLPSWSRAVGTDLESDANRPMMEGVNELVFYFEPQTAAAGQDDDQFDCEIQGTFPCPPLNGGGSLSATSALNDIPAACSGGSPCTFSRVRWVNAHIAVQTHLKAKNAAPGDLNRFADRLEPLRTKTHLDAVAPDAVTALDIDCPG